MYEPPRVFIDTNIFKFSSVKKHVYAKRRKLITWGNFRKEIDLHVPYTLNDLNKIKSNIRRRDAVSLGMLAHVGMEGRIEFLSHREVDNESAGLPNMVSASGRFFGCPIEWVTVRSRCPAAQRVGRIVSALDSGHYGVLGGAEDETALD